MRAASVIEDFATWSPDGHEFAVRYRIVVMRDIIAEATEAFALIPRGGVEIGGILYGRHEDRRTVILEAWRPLVCDYSKGPSFECGEAEVQRVLSAAAADAQLAGLEPVGWWHSHTRSELSLSEGDLEFFNRFFPEPWHVAAVVRPRQLQPTRIGFFFREPDGSVHTEASYQEFTLPRGPRPQPAPEVLDTGAALAPVPPAEIAAPPLVLAPARRAPDAVSSWSDPIVAAPAPRRVRREGVLQGVAALVLATLAAAGLWQFWPRASSDIALRITGKSNTVFIEWDSTSRPVERSHAADLEIREGGDPPRYFRLEPRQLRAGRVSYVRSSPEITARMRLYGWGDDSKDWIASFIGPPLQAVPETSTPPASAPAEPVRNLAASSPPPATATLAESVPLSSRSRESDSAIRPERRADLRLPPARPVSIPVQVQPLPAPQMRAVGQPSLSVAMPSPINPTAGVPPPPSNPPAQPVRTLRIDMPRAGRAIWTGELRPGATLVIDNARPSFGNLTGHLPAGPLRVSAHAAELGDHGIVIYSADPRTRDREGAFESPSARNGWNLTTYKWDPKRAGELATLQTPGPANDWRRLALRNSGKKLSVIVLDWEVLPGGKPASDARP